jgi:hypothetical protein
MSTANLSAIERGAQGYRQPGLEALAQVYECDPAQLLSVDPTTKGDLKADAVCEREAIWSIWNKARPSERELIINVAAAILKTRTR